MKIGKEFNKTQEKQVRGFSFFPFLSNSSNIGKNILQRDSTDYQLIYLIINIIQNL